MREYTDRLRIAVTPEQRELIKRKMKEAGIMNMSAYVRKMAIDGLIIRVDTSDLNELTRLVRINADNLNQYTKRANETGSIYLEDIKELNAQQEKIWIALKEVWGLFASMGI